MHPASARPSRSRLPRLRIRSWRGARTSRESSCLEAIIGADGFVREVRILRSASFLLEAPALETVRKWRYRAATVEGRGVPVYLTVVVTFSLR